MTQKFDDLYKKYMAFNGIMLEEYRPMELAAVLVTQGLTFYKSALPPDEYEKMVDTIYANRHHVKTFE
jgi:hypothetical protein